jgi:NodT family efflux transporter outer membrane factor (OMF) lipoprotein
MKTLFSFIFVMLLGALPVSGQSLQQLFPDAALSAMINEALAANSDVRTARLNVVQAQAQLSSAKLAYLPAIALAPQGTLSKYQHQSATKDYSLPLTMSWEVNLAGGFTHEKNAQKAQWMSAESQLQYVQVQLVAAVANAYYTLVMLDRQLAITKESVKNQQANLDAIRALKEVGDQNELAVSQAQASLQSTIASESDLQLQVEKAENSLCLLLNRQPGSLQRSSWVDVKGISLNASLPVDIQQLAQRPDVLAAEYQLRAAFSNVKVARSAFYPSLSISANAGWTNNVGQIVNPAQFLLNAVGSLTQPLFQKGKLRANLKVAKAQREQAQIAFEKALLTAGGEVKDALAECQQSLAKQQARQTQVDTSRKAYETSIDLMTYSSDVTYLDVLTAQSSYLNAQLEQTADWLQYQQGLINLYKATCSGVEN